MPEYLASPHDKDAGELDGSACPELANPASAAFSTHCVWEFNSQVPARKMTFHPVRTRKTFEEVIEQITDAIRAGDLPVGSALPSERAIAIQMEISRPTLREAVKVLADLGVLRVVAGSGGGIFVHSDVVPPALLSKRSELRIGEVAGVLEARRLLEPRVAQLAAHYGREEDFEALRQVLELEKEATNERDRFTQLDLRFHMAIARATHNKTIAELVKMLLHNLEIARDMAMRGPHEPEWTIDIHERTLRAILGGDPENIETVMGEHLSLLERLWEQETGRPRLRRPPPFLVANANRHSRT